jgi:hypothetical protein
VGPQTTSRTDRPTFLSKCEPVAADFFAHMLEEARRKGMIVNWGSLGFSVRLPLEPAVTIMFGYPPDDFQVYTRDWKLGEQGRAGFHDRLRDEWGLELSGKFTNKLAIGEATLQRGHKVLDFMWVEAERMMVAARAQGD